MRELKMSKHKNFNYVPSVLSLKKINSKPFVTTVKKKQNAKEGMSPYTQEKPSGD